MRSFVKAAVAAAFVSTLFVACSDDSSSTSADSGTVVEESSASQEPSSSEESAVQESSDSQETSSPESSVSQEPTSSESSVSQVSSSSEKSATPASSDSTPVSSASESKDNAFFTENWREDCLAKINEYRATENLDPLVLADDEKQACTDKEAADDMAENKAHGHMGDCGEHAQNSGPNFSTSWHGTASEVAESYLKMMWEDEKALVTSGERDPEKSEDYRYIGHYLNMKGDYTKVACGIALSEDGKKGWFNVNFF